MSDFSYPSAPLSILSIQVQDHTRDTYPVPHRSNSMFIKHIPKIVRGQVPAADWTSDIASMPGQSLLNAISTMLFS